MNGSSREGGGARRARMVFTTRHGGFSASPHDSFNLGDHVGDDPAAVHANRLRLAGNLGIDPARFAWMRQIHSATVAVVDGPVDGPVPDTDALVTTVTGLALVVLVADCVPVLLADDSAGVVAAVHAGRVGARDGIVAHAVAAMEGLGARSEAIRAHLGPAAGGGEYEVPREMADDVDKHLPGSKTRTRRGTPGIDVRAGIRRQLEGLGVRDITVDRACTISDPRYFSYRREGLTGRQAGIIVLPGAE